MKSFTAGDKGEVAIESPGKGLFLLEAAVSEDKAGGESQLVNLELIVGEQKVSAFSQ